MSDTSPADIEKRLYAEWEEQGCFEAGRVDGDPYTIGVPPPNVTGNLHMACLNNTLQDILADLNGCAAEMFMATWYGPCWHCYQWWWSVNR